jgi:hypothetical protein
MTLTRSQVNRITKTLKREYRCTMSVARKMALGLSRGFSHAFVVSLEDGTRIVGCANSSDEARKAFFAAEHAALKRGVRSLGGSQAINLKIFAPAVSVEAVQPAMKRAA